MPVMLSRPLQSDKMMKWVGLKRNLMPGAKQLKKATGILPQKFRLSIQGLQRCAQEPGLEFFFAEAVDFAAGEFAGGDGEDLVEDSLAGLLYVLFAVDDGAAVDVHVVGHAVVEGGVGGDFERWRGLAAEDGAAAGGEADDVGSAGDLAGGGDGIEAR